MAVSGRQFPILARFRFPMISPTSSSQPLTLRTRHQRLKYAVQISMEPSTCWNPAGCGVDSLLSSRKKTGMWLHRHSANVFALKSLTTQNLQRLCIILWLQKELCHGWGMLSLPWPWQLPSRIDERYRGKIFVAQARVEKILLICYTQGEARAFGLC